MLLLLLIFATSAASWVKPTKVYMRAMENALEAEAALHVCRAASSRERLQDVQCFETALRHFRYNASWMKQVGALYIMTAQRSKAAAHFNESLSLVLEANGFLDEKVSNSGGSNISAVGWLKLYHSREKEGSLELGKVWFESYLLQNKFESAKIIIDQFIAPLEEFSESIDMYRNMGNIGRVVDLKLQWRQHKDESRKKKGKGPIKNRETVAAVVAEELVRMAEELASRWLSSPLTATKEGNAESLMYSRNTCGLSFKFKDRYTVNEIVHYLSICVAKWGNFKTLLAPEGQSLTFGALLRTPLHVFAAFSTEYLVLAMLDKHSDLLGALDNFGWTPLHVAAAHGNKRAFSSLLKGGASRYLHQKDAGGVTPLDLACSNIPFRKEAEKLIAAELQLPNPCLSTTILPSIHDEEADDEDNEVALGGGWTDAQHNPDTSQCHFDVRTGTSLSHHELVGRYLHSNKPVVLRGVIPAFVRKPLQKKVLNRTFGTVRVRHEQYPTAEHFGGSLFGVKNISEWMSDSSHFATVEIPKKHLLSSTLQWVPSRLIPPEEGYTVAMEEAWPLLVVAAKGATTNHAFKGSHSFFAVVHGIQRWVASPPSAARATRALWDDSVSDDTLFKCTLHSGDVIVLPSLWSVAFKSVGESVGFQRRFVWK